MFTNGRFSAPSGIKVCVFGANSGLGTMMTPQFLRRGTPCVLAHRNALEPFSPVGDDTTFTRSNPYRSMLPWGIQYDVVNAVIML